MRIKWNIDMAKEYYNSHGYELLEEVYINNRFPMKIKTQDGYITHLCLSNLQQGQNVFIFGRNNEYTLQNIQHFINLNNSATKLLSTQFKNNMENLTFQCQCGNIFKRTWGNMQKFKSFDCPRCIKQRRAQKECKDFGSVRSLFLENNLKLLSTEAQYENNETKLKAVTQDGYKVSISYGNLLNGKKPTILGLSYNKEFFDYNMDLWLKNNHVECEYIGVSDIKKKRILCRCCCGNTFSAEYIDVARGRKVRCSVCTKQQSHYSLLTEQWLIDNNIVYVKEKRYRNCKDKQSLPFDFYLVDFNILIEVDGEQHFNDNSLYSSPLIQYHDSIKDKFCLDNHIKLIRIPYWKYYGSEYKNILSLNILQE